MTTTVQPFNHPLVLRKGQSAATQRQVLDAMLKTLGRNEVVAVVGHFIWQTAVYIHDELSAGAGHIHNRPTPKRTVERYSHSMATEQWGMTGQPVIFSRDGLLLDGRHRIKAMIQSRTGITTLIVFGVDAAEFAKMDIGRKRTGPDAVTVATNQSNSGQIARALRWLIIFASDTPEDRGRIVENTELIEKLATVDQERLSLCSEQASAVRRKVRRGNGAAVLADGAVAAMFYLWGEKHGQPVVDKFVAALCGNKGKQVQLLRKKLGKMLDANGGRVHEAVRNAMLVYTFKAWRSNRDLPANFDKLMPSDMPPVVD